MPNWCHNRLEITGDHSTIKQLASSWEEVGFDDRPKKIESKNLLFAQYIPEPVDIKDWYQWRLDNWGCKWDCQLEEVFRYGVEKDLEEELLVLQFDSPWSPPIKGIKKISLKFPNSSFQLDYEEPGCNFRGQIIIQNGCEMYHIQGDYYGEIKTCSNCGEEYSPEINLQGKIEYDYCDNCGTEY